MPFGFDSYQSLQQAGVSDPAAQTIADLFQQVGFDGAPAERLTQLYQQAREMAQAQQGGRPQTSAPAVGGNPLADAASRFSAGRDGRSMSPGDAGSLPGAGGFGGLSASGAKRGMQIGSLLGMGAMGPMGMLAPALMGGIVGGIHRRATAPGLPGGFMTQVGGGPMGYTGGFASQVDTGGVQGAPSRGGGGRDGGYSGGGFASQVDTGGVRSGRGGGGSRSGRGRGGGGYGGGFGAAADTGGVR